MFNQPYNPILFDSYWRDKKIKINLIFSLLINLSLWVGLLWQERAFSDSIPLHYNIYYGIDLLGPWYQILLLPGLGLIFLVLNFGLASIFYRKEKIVSYFLVFSCSFVQLIFILASMLIVLINY
ncbi:MAG: hypothetical protein WC508_00085 [Patescibacteria group bacterium]